MDVKIDVLKSIRKKRLFYETGSFVADYLVTYLGSLFFIFLASAFLIGLIKVLPLYATLLILAFITWMLANLILFNILIEIKGSEMANNRKEIIKLINQLYKVNIEDHGQTVLYDVKYSGFLRWGRIVTVLLNNDFIYVNVQTLGRADAFSLFHGLTNYLKGKHISREFKQIQNRLNN